MYPRNRVLPVAAAALLSLCLGAATLADDTEIFVATPTTTLRPNVMIIIDTSGSMDTLVNVRAPYNPSGTYSGAGATCDESRVYWKVAASTGGTTPPTCGTTQWVARTNFLCKSLEDDLNTYGRKAMKYVAQWDASPSGTNNDRWKELTAGRNTEVECKADSALNHGRADNDNLVPANAANGPFFSNASGDLINWNSGTSGSATNKSYVFYTGKYLNYLAVTPVTDTRSRIDIVKDAAKRVIDSTTLDGTNVGLMAFNSKYYGSSSPSGFDDHHRGGMVLHQFAPIESSRTALKNIIGNPSDAAGGATGLAAESYTPLSEVLFEAYRYFTGGAVLYGLDSSPSASVAASRTGNNYNNPITSSCLTNYIFYLTDGDPTDDMEAEPLITALPNYNTVLGRTGTAICTDNGAQAGSLALGSQAGDGRCLDDLAEYMFKRDFYDDAALAANDEVVESVRTFTISFGDSISTTAQLLLEETARLGGGENFIATDPVSLEEAFDSAAANIAADSVSFTAPTVSVNAFNRTRTLNDLFFTVFEPARTFHWPGNLKKFRIDPNGTIMAFNNVPAVDDSTGFFAEGAQSYWSDTVDGPEVTEGGAAHELPTPATRNVFTDVAAPGTPGLSATTNSVVSTNVSITAAMLGLPGSATAADRIDLINWARGADAYNVDVTLRTQARFEIGDPLHARPVSVIYGGTATAPQAVVYVATNDGYLHAINPNGASNSAEELWTYMPSELLSRLNSLHSGANSSTKQYALDGNLSVYKVDVDGDGIVEAADGDKVWLFFGMGRGGRNYYALDVTNKNAPVFKWREGSATTGMSGLGYTWSTPIPTKVSIDSGSGPVVREVVIFGGGYDPAQDGGTVAATQANFRRDSIGNGLYMLNADTGALLWSAGETTGNLQLADMEHSIPADVRVIDLTGDGLADRMYAADTGGRIWRFDIINGAAVINGTTDSGLVRGGVFASLGVASGIGSSPGDARRFYTAPDVSVVRANNTTYLNIAIGSGFRGHPVNTAVNDRFYSLRDPIPFRAMTVAEYNTMTADPIVDNPSATTPDLVDITTTNGTPTIPVTASGWKINFTNGEKVLSDAQTFGGSVLFSTFTPSGNTTQNACSARSGTNRFYSMLALNGRAHVDRDGDGTFEAEDRNEELEQSGIAPTAVILFPTADIGCTGQACSPPPVCLVGPESCGISFTNDPVKTFWMQKEVD